MRIPAIKHAPLAFPILELSKQLHLVRNVSPLTHSLPYLKKLQTYYSLDPSQLRSNTDRTIIVSDGLYECDT
jgi:hypothetical protein